MASCLRIADYAYRTIGFFSIVLNPLTLRYIYYEDESVFAESVSRFRLHVSNYKSKVVPLRVRCGPEGSRRFRLPGFHDIRHMKLMRSPASPTGRLYPQECSWYSFSLGAEVTPEPWCGRKEICH
jgi:hypothetical protein